MVIYQAVERRGRQRESGIVKNKKNGKFRPKINFWDLKN